MTPIDRYLARVSFWLPRGRRADILTDLRGLLLDRIERAEDSMGQPLDENGQQSLFATMEPPIVLVARYVDRPPVISGALAFFYWRVLMLAAVVVIATHGSIILSTAIRARSSPDLGLAITDAVQHCGFALLLAFAIVTLIFVLLDHYRRGRV